MKAQLAERVYDADRFASLGAQPTRLTIPAGIGSAVVDVTPGDYFELIARQTSGATKNVAADELTWFAIEVVE